MQKDCLTDVPMLQHTDIHSMSCAGVLSLYDLARNIFIVDLELLCVQVLSYRSVF